MAEAKNQIWLARFRPLEIDNVGGDQERELWIASNPIIVEFEQAGDPPSGVIPGVMTQPHQLSVDATDADFEIATRSLPSFGDVVFGDPDGRFQELAGWTFARRAVDLWLGDEGEPFWRDPPVWSALCEEAQWERHEITVPTVGVEDLLARPLHPNVFTPGFEPYVIFDGVDHQIDFGNNLFRGSAGFTIGCAFRTTTSQGAFLYGKKNLFGSTNEGYALRLGAGGAVGFNCADGADLIETSFVPPGGYDDGERHTLVGVRDGSSNELRLYFDGALVDTEDASALDSVTNGLNLKAGASGTNLQFFNGEIERLVQRVGAFAPSVISALDERYAEDVDASNFDHYVPLTENTGTLAGDLSSRGVDGTISGTGGSDSFWSGLQNGHAGLDGRPKPIGIGNVRHCRPILMDPVKHVYMFHDITANPDPQPAVGDVTDRGQLIPADDTLPLGPIWTVPPGAGEYFSEDGLIRINPAGLADQVKLSVSFANLRGQGTPQNAESAFNYVLSDLHGFLTSIAPIVELRYQVGYYWRDEVSIGRAVDEIVEGYSGLWSTESRNPFDVAGTPIFRLRAVPDVNEPLPPSPGWATAHTILIDPDVISVGDLIVAEDGLRRVGVAEVPDSVVLEYDRFQGFFGEGELLDPGVTTPFQLRTLAGLTSEFRRARSDAPQAVLDRFDAQSPLDVRTGIRSNDDAQTEAARLMTLRGQLVEVWECELTGPRRRFEGWVGDLVEVIGPLPTFESGRLFMVVGVRDDADTSGSTLKLWAPRPGTAPT